MTVPAGGNLQSAVNAASNGSTICLGGNVTSTTQIAVSSRSGLTIDGNGHTLTSSGYHPALYFRCSTNVAVQDLKIVGSHPSPGTYIAGSEHAHGLHVDGGSGYTFDRLTIDRMQGDGLYVGQCGTTWANGVTIRDTSIRNNGRMGIAVVAGRNVRAERMTYYNIAYSLVDVEPDWNATYQQGGTDLTFSGGTSTGWVGRFTSGLVDAPAFTIATPYGAQPGKFAPIIERVTIEDYTVAEGITGIRTTISAGGGYRIKDVTIRRNTGVKVMAGVGAGDGMVNAWDVDGLFVTNNSNPVKAGAYAVNPSGSTNLAVSGNTGTGLVGQIAP